MNFEKKKKKFSLLADRFWEWALDGNSYGIIKRRWMKNRSNLGNFIVNFRC